MKKVVVEKPHRAEVREVPMPELSGENEVLIQIKSADARGSDHHIYHGLNSRSTYPRISGHENAGVVVKAGSVVASVKMGDRVTVDLTSTCGTCHQCWTGRKDVYEHVRIRGSDAGSDWKEYLTTPMSEVHKIDDSMDWKGAALMGPYAIGTHCTDRARIALEDVVSTLGAGTIDSTILQTCKTRRC